MFAKSDVEFYKWAAPGTKLREPVDKPQGRLHGANYDSQGKNP